MTFEGMTAEQVERFGAIERFISAPTDSDHQGLIAGQFTDETQLMLATMRASVAESRDPSNSAL